MGSGKMDNTRSDDRWLVVSRGLEYEGESRAALLRVVLVAIFYGAQLLHFTVFAQPTEVEQIFHRQATLVAAGWLCVSLAVLVMLTRRWLPNGLKFATVGIDLILLTLLAALGSGPGSPRVYVYWVVIVLAGLRGNLALIWFGTIAAMASYLFLVAMRTILPNCDRNLGPSKFVRVFWSRPSYLPY